MGGACLERCCWSQAYLAPTRAVDDIVDDIVYDIVYDIGGGFEVRRLASDNDNDNDNDSNMTLLCSAGHTCVWAQFVASRRERSKDWALPAINMNKMKARVVVGKVGERILVVDTRWLELRVRRDKEEEKVRT